MNKRVIGVLVLLVGLCVVSQIIRVVIAVLTVPKPAVVAPTPVAAAKRPAIGDPEPTCDDPAFKAEFAKQTAFKNFDDYCAGMIAGPRLVWRNKHLHEMSDETICSWKSPYHVALKCEGTLSEEDPFMIASTTISEVGAESISWVLEQWREPAQIPRDIEAFRKLGLEPYAAVLEKAKASLNDKSKVEALQTEWDELEKQRIFQDWFEKNCAALVKCSPH